MKLINDWATVYDVEKDLRTIDTDEYSDWAIVLYRMVHGLKEIAKERVEEYGYGGFLGGDPRDFQPDSECCSPEELAAHKEACALFDTAEKEGRKIEELPCESGWVGNVHITKTRFGIGNYKIKVPTDGAIKAMEVLTQLGIEY